MVVADDGRDAESGKNSVQGPNNSGPNSGANSGANSGVNSLRGAMSRGVSQRGAWAAPDVSAPVPEGAMVVEDFVAMDDAEGGQGQGQAVVTVDKATVSV
jgi:hypothetical protein